MSNVRVSIEFPTSENSPGFLPGINLSKHFEDLKLVMQVSYMMIGNVDAISRGVKLLIADGVTPTKQILSELQMMASDDFDQIMKLVGEETACAILNYKP